MPRRKLLAWLLVLSWLSSQHGGSALASQGGATEISRLVKVGGIEYRLFSHKTGEWLTHDQYMESGGGNWNEFDLSLLALIEINPAEPLQTTVGKVRVQAFKGDVPIDKVTFSVPFTSSGDDRAYTLPVLVSGPLCERITVTAETLDEGDKPFGKEQLVVPFRCGE